uniref:J domain-containing protein n=1 Tax=Chromera velia CCMP2878 TaxID=1169474 RepID=A0A0G4FQT1_9ALVE|eukprot:Cvel_18133.t1-p1 / transcript=Cvel_18133.t1 / gene=Cvel_18133 / organism=Chromera_velia_CCMP2878 / gene_product=DnaJ protein homolog, putative / transcript_product=DnaJ protein homolog, putative / location=Cvel_scaffold1488:19556-24323(-) / protein_length=1284 / sequence_SO=supercontig / SO=protein_coding / is_pseudo=false
MDSKYYNLLGVSPNASKDEIKRAYRRLALKNHPDHGGDPAMMKLINEAKEVLIDGKELQTADDDGDAWGDGSDDSDAEASTAPASSRAGGDHPSVMIGDGIAPSAPFRAHLASFEEMVSRPDFVFFDCRGVTFEAANALRPQVRARMDLLYSKLSEETLRRFIGRPTPRGLRHAFYRLEGLHTLFFSIPDADAKASALCAELQQTCGYDGASFVRAMEGAHSAVLCEAVRMFRERVGSAAEGFSAPFRAGLKIAEARAEVARRGAPAVPKLLATLQQDHAESENGALMGDFMEDALAASLTSPILHALHAVGLYFQLASLSRGFKYTDALFDPPDSDRGPIGADTGVNLCFQSRRGIFLRPIPALVAFRRISRAISRRLAAGELSNVEAAFCFIDAAQPAPTRESTLSCLLAAAHLLVKEVRQLCANDRPRSAAAVDALLALVLQNVWGNVLFDAAPTLELPIMVSALSLSVASASAIATAAERLGDHRAPTCPSSSSSYSAVGFFRGLFGSRSTVQRPEQSLAVSSSEVAREETLRVLEEPLRVTRALEELASDPDRLAQAQMKATCMKASLERVVEVSVLWPVSPVRMVEPFSGICREVMLLGPALTKYLHSVAGPLTQTGGTLEGPVAASVTPWGCERLRGLYTLWQGQWSGWISSPDSEEKEKELRGLLMEEVVRRKGERFSRIEDLMENLHSASEGVSDSDRFVVVGADLDSGRFETLPGGSLTAQELQEIRSSCYVGLFFSLDQPSNAETQDGAPFHMHHHPFQECRSMPFKTADSSVMRALLHADYILKMLTTGVEVDERAPFSFRTPEGSWETVSRLPQPLLNYLREPLEAENRPSGVAHRFWVEAGPVPIEIDGSSVRVGEPLISVRKQLLKKQADGTLTDASECPEDDDDTPEAEFARRFSLVYDQVAEVFPVFKKLVEIAKASAVARLWSSVATGLRKEVDESRERGVGEAERRKAREVLAHLRGQVTEWPLATSSNVEYHLGEALRKQGLSLYSNFAPGVLSGARRDIRSQLEAAEGRLVTQLIEALGSSGYVACRSDVISWLNRRQAPSRVVDGVAEGIFRIVQTKKTEHLVRLRLVGVHPLLLGADGSPAGSPHVWVDGWVPSVASCFRRRKVYGGISLLKGFVVNGGGGTGGGAGGGSGGGPVGLRCDSKIAQRAVDRLNPQRPVELMTQAGRSHGVPKDRIVEAAPGVVIKDASANAPDRYHRAGAAQIRESLQRGTLQFRNGSYEQFTLPGKLDGKFGRFEVGITHNKTPQGSQVTHTRFKEAEFKK